VFERCGLGIDAMVPELGMLVGDALLEPTRIYAKAVRDALDVGRGKPAVHGMAHITGGGLADNLERILPEGCRVTIDRKKWEPNPVYAWLNSLGQIAWDEMFRVFNMGIGYVMVVAPRQANAICEKIEAHGIKTTKLGKSRGPRVELH
jgi:phosphoribosylformylglycinamidine cyclo-ligase